MLRISCEETNRVTNNNEDKTVMDQIRMYFGFGLDVLLFCFCRIEKVFAFSST